jgi:putative hemolysin
MTYRRDETTDARSEPPRFITTLAEDPSTVLAAQRLRYRVFHAAHATSDATPLAANSGVDQDAFDAHCEHLVVRDARSGDVVGTYRILTAERAREAGGFYSETEFDCARLRRLDARLVEVGRACVDPDYRGGSVITLLLTGLTRWVVANRYDYVMGCASIDVTRGMAEAATLCRRLVHEHLAAGEWRVVPHTPFRPGEYPPCAAELPPLIKAYLRFGASVCGEPAWDAEFQTADVLMLLPMAAMDPRFRARLLRDDPGPRTKKRSSRWAA